MRGSQTEPKKVEEAKALVAQTNNISAVSRLLEIPRETIRDIVLKDDDFAEFRQQVQKEYIVKTWGNILEIESALAGKIKRSDLSRLPLREITGALRDLKQTVESVFNNINSFNQLNVNDNKQVVYSGSPEQNQEIDDFVIERYMELKKEGKVE